MGCGSNRVSDIAVVTNGAGIGSITLIGAGGRCDLGLIAVFAFISALGANAVSPFVIFACNRARVTALVDSAVLCFSLGPGKLGACVIIGIFGDGLGIAVLAGAGEGLHAFFRTSRLFGDTLGVAVGMEVRAADITGAIAVPVVMVTGGGISSLSVGVTTDGAGIGGEASHCTSRSSHYCIIVMAQGGNFCIVIAFSAGDTGMGCVAFVSTGGSSHS